MRWRTRLTGTAVPTLLPVLLLTLMAGVTGCAQPTSHAAPIQRPSPTPSATPSAEPSPSESPTAPPSPSPTASRPKPTGPPASPKPPSGTGPGGSALRTGTGAVALTFDDGPYPMELGGSTPAMLDLLKEQGVHATFCVVGTMVRDHHDLVQRIVAEGHTLCNHSWQHDISLAKKSDADIRADLQNTLDEIHRAVPDAKVSYFRAPGGNFTTHLVALAKELGMKSIYWAVDPRDWDSAQFGTGQKMVDHIISNVEGNVRPGSIVLSHDKLKPNTVTAYRTLLPWLKARYTLIPLPVDITP